MTEEAQVSKPRFQFSLGMLLMLFLAFAAGYTLCDVSDSLRLLLETIIYQISGSNYPVPS